MITLDLIVPSVEEIGETVVEQTQTGNMIVPIVAVLVVVAIAVVIVSKAVITKGLKSAK